ncbi:MAG TPA: chromosome segregation protein SMC [Pirellulales bacterium]|jgi:chromosome segregation protein|nr:chromosome segregation protein SMC [Pirellulales bacterium]
MLKALELVGFKSFADKTRLEFPRGITVVVGPNGSGKSNIVDAIKWVLGEQSVKSLRGKEMVDIIFNGSADRRPLNAAETTLTFDNSQRLLSVDTPEVHVTRRVYRSGEGEYLINRQPCRLRDIRELFSGTGVATEAYSVIEQGKVDILLQSSPRERRLIFEEAAGISRFKAKKVESLRRLERVEQNLLRLSDIVDEVENRLRAVRLQAGKARRYKEYSDRLQSLRTQIALVDWRALTAKIDDAEAQLGELRAVIQAQINLALAQENEAHALEAQLDAADIATRASESEIAQIRERIAAGEAAADHERRHALDLEDAIVRYRRQLTSMGVRAGDLLQQLREVLTSVEQAEQEHRDVARRLAEEERTLTRLTSEVDELRSDIDRRRTAQIEAMRTAGALASQISALESRVVSLEAGRERSGKRLAELAAEHQALDGRATSLAQELERTSTACAQCEERLDNIKTAIARCRAERASAREQLVETRERRTRASERAAVLEELERRREGIGTGTKNLLARAAQAKSGPLANVRGLVADLLHVRLETAPIIEAALGDLSQCVVVDKSTELIAHLAASGELDGRVGLVRLDAPPVKTHLDAVDLGKQAGVVGRADQFVETEPAYAGLARQLLGRTWIVETLAHAIALADSVGRGLDFVTRDGELLSADGTACLGPRTGSAGLISRRSELRELGEQIARLTQACEAQQQICSDLDERISTHETELQRESAELAKAHESHQAVQLHRQAVAERSSQLDSQIQALEAECALTAREHAKAQETLASARTQLAKNETALAQLESQLTSAASELAGREQNRQRASREAAAAKIEVVKSEQRLTHLRAEKIHLERDQQERSRTLADSRSQLAIAVERLRDAEREILACESELAELYLRKENVAAVAARHTASREQWRAKNLAIRAEAERARNRQRKLEARLHAGELAATEVRHERSALADRLREDYSIELADLELPVSSDELEQRANVEREISDLRAKLNSIGGVNLDALAELEELETRYATLSAQHADLTAAKNSLEAIIGKINADSRRLFSETLEVVRGHFQSLFRKLFGGGQADIVLDEGVDILDSGIEIVARPPGKEPRSISLLSGGEKTLTCVAMLLAIFRSRPSPFCVLDEVDAALDEANIERFISVLQEFLAWTQFIVVTHSKKTMTCASTLYGITMEESGVSKRVSVRFEDVSDNGEILNVRPDRTDGESEDDVQAA